MIGILMMVGSVLLTVVLGVSAYTSTLRRLGWPQTYDPSNPQKSLTDTNKSNPLSDFATWSFCCGPIFFIFGAVFLFVSTRKSQIVG